MPIYDYRCTKCGDFEHSQSIKDQPLTTCPTCGNQVKRLISNNVGIIFKGSGFYINDSRSANKGSIASSNSNGSTDSDSSSNSNTNSNSSSNTDTKTTSSSSSTSDSTKSKNSGKAS